MAKEHHIYWLSTEESGEGGVGRNWYYIKDARREAQKIANEQNTEVYINQAEDIVDVIYPKKPKEPQRYYFYYDSHNISPIGNRIGFWRSGVANSKKAILEAYNPKGKHYAKHVKKVYTEAEAAEIAKTDKRLAELMKQYAKENTNAT